MADKLYHAPTVQTPSIAKLRQIAAKYGMDEIPDEDLKQYQEKTLDDYITLNKYPEPTLPVKYPRTPGYRPSKEENTSNAWYYKTDIKGASEGKLVGKKIAIKDNIPVAGVPMMDGTSTLEGYTPEFDATVITRILDAGGHIVGKAVCEHFCFSGGSFTPSSGPITNPHHTAHQAGGSSGGSAALVAAGEVDMALGRDQGGSIRLPACWCGIVGLKPTWGLVPYTGIAMLEQSLDHVGPMASNVHDCALLLEVIAGHDGGLDPRQPVGVKPDKYTQSLTGDLTGVKVGLLEEGFEGSAQDVASIVKSAAMMMMKAGAIVEDVSIPMHKDGTAIWTPVIIEGCFTNMVDSAGACVGVKGFHPTSMLTAISKAFKSSANDLTPTLKLLIMIGDYLKENYGPRYYAKAQNIARLLTAAYDKALETYDVLVMPTRRNTASKLPTGEPSIEEYLHSSLDDIENTAPTDATGHPALSINAGFSEGLPVGMMIVGKHWHDATVLKVAHAFEQLRDAK